MSFDPNATTRIQRAVNLHNVPAEKWPTMVKRTITGALLVGAGLAGGKWFGFPWYAVAGAVLLGATTWSGQMVGGALRALLGPVKAYRRALAKDEPTDG